MIVLAGRSDTTWTLETRPKLQCSLTQNQCDSKFVIVRNSGYYRMPIRDTAVVS